MDAEEIATSIRGKLFQTYLPPPSQCSIFKVPNMLRKDNGKAFTPEVVSIGPYHHENKQLQAMGNIKLWYLKCLLYRTRTTELESLIKAIESIEQDCRKCYAEVLVDLSGDKFIEMMLIDGCFILEFLCRYLESRTEQLQGEEDPVFETAWMPRKIIADLLLLENQLPWCLLDCLFNLIYSSTTTHQRLDDLVSFSFSEYKMFPAAQSPRSHEKHTHILDCFRNSDLLLLENQLPWCLLDCLFNLIYSSTTTHQRLDDLVSFSFSEYKMFPAAQSPRSHEKHTHILDCFRNCLVGSSSVKRPYRLAPSEWKSVLPVTELLLRQIPLIAKDGHNILDVKFERRAIKIPTLVIEENTESVFRNLIAFEHCDSRKGYEITSYAALLDCLIKSPADALHLKEKHILLFNGLGNIEDRANFLNRLLYNNDASFHGFLYSDLCQRLNTICSLEWNEYKATLRRDYFNEPWAPVTFVFGIVFSLILSIVQTLYAILSYNASKPAK